MLYRSTSSMCQLKKDCGWQAAKVWHEDSQHRDARCPHQAAPPLGKSCQSQTSKVRYEQAPSGARGRGAGGAGRGTFHMPK